MKLFPFMAIALLVWSFNCSKVDFLDQIQSKEGNQHLRDEPMAIETEIDESLQTAFVTFQGKYPDSHLAKTDQISIRGNNCNLTWNKGVPLNKSGSNTWTTMLACQTNVIILVKLVLNDEIWMMGPNFWFEVSTRANLTIYPSFKPKINEVYDTESIKSDHLQYARKCSIYLPPSYHDNLYKKYKVVFMHDGQNLFQNSKAAFGVAWKIQDTMNELIGDEQISESIIVGIWNSPDRTNQYTYSYDSEYKTGGKGDLYLDWIQNELEPLVVGKWFPGRVSNETGYIIGGSSLGGLISCYAMYTRPTFFSKSICMSSSFWWNNEDFHHSVIPSGKYNTNTIVYIDSGNTGPSKDGMNQTLMVKAHFQKIGYSSDDQHSRNLFYYLDKGGQHNELYWGKRFYIPLNCLFYSGKDHTAYLFQDLTDENENFLLE